MTDQEINEAVARKLGLCVSCTVQTHLHKMPDFCRSIEAAWECVLKMGEHAKVHVSYEDYLGPKYTCVIFSDGGGGTYERLASTKADTAPMAICLSFLKLVDQ